MATVCLRFIESWLDCHCIIQTPRLWVCNQLRNSASRRSHYSSLRRDTNFGVNSVLEVMEVDHIRHMRLPQCVQNEVAGNLLVFRMMLHCTLFTILCTWSPWSDNGFNYHFLRNECSFHPIQIWFDRKRFLQFKDLKSCKQSSSNPFLFRRNLVWNLCFIITWTLFIIRVCYFQLILFNRYDAYRNYRANYWPSQHMKLTFSYYSIKASPSPKTWILYRSAHDREVHHFRS